MGLYFSTLCSRLIYLFHLTNKAYIYLLNISESNFETPTKTVTMTTVQYSQYAHLMKDNVDKTKMFLDMDQSKAYADSRPSYTDEMFKTIADYCKETNPDLNLAVDVGCGPGMSTIGFAKYFKKVKKFFSLLSYMEKNPVSKQYKRIFINIFKTMGLGL